MSHIHILIDFVVTAFIVHRGKILLVHHKRLDKWLPVGGHIELDEDPEQALFREIEEETGLRAECLTVLSDKPNIKDTSNKILYTPNFLDIHQITSQHRHVGLIYVLASMSDQIRLLSTEHNHIEWFNPQQLVNLELSPAISFYAQTAISMTQENHDADRI